MSLNEKEKEILKEIEENLSKDDPHLAQTVGTTTLSVYSRFRSLISLVFFSVGLLTMFGTYIILPALAISGFVVMAISGYLFVTNIKLLLRSENIDEWNLKIIYRLIRNQDSSRQN
jgi:ABC-type uncharacterized transport system fused permease/ATPase subunit